MPSPPRRLFPAVLGLVGLTLALAACGGEASAPPASAVATPESAAVSRGTIFALRPLSSRRTGVQASILAAMGTARDMGPAGSVEIIIRRDDGATLSIVGGNDPGLRVGDRITLIQGTRTRIAAGPV